ncbi:hypothetical protein C9374_010141 [Naegleria lovaniensis]|uniref:F-box domain-containing protein n=1 Tax=Naegleria lovaniensis TaxID=51637 RepID=A0AA88GCM2_NAELO|nr:uncharacterized protein C9374_010141 [Naegleria lovaniensis]KAG2375137.1 hypothetical protein C9374_010141 [Naegleria lovaniensis]
MTLSEATQQHALIEALSMHSNSSTCSHQLWFQHFPSEIILHIISFLHPVELLTTMSHVCRHWRGDIVRRVFFFEQRKENDGKSTCCGNDNAWKFSNEYPQWKRYQELNHSFFRQLFSHPTNNQLITKWNDLFHNSNHFGSLLQKFYVRDYFLVMSQRCVTIIFKKNMNAKSSCLDQPAPNIIQELPVESWLDEELNHYWQILIPYLCLNQEMKQKSEKNNENENTEEGFFWRRLSALKSFLKRKLSNRDETQEAHETSIHPLCEFSKQQTRTPIHVRMVVYGSHQVGKTSLANAMMKDSRVEPSKTGALGICFGRKVCKIGEDRITMDMTLLVANRKTSTAHVSIEPWLDKGATCVLMLFDITNRDSYMYATEQLRMLQKTKTTERMVECLLIGTKSDQSSKRQISSEEAQQFAFHEMGGSLYLEITNMSLKDSQVIMWYCALLHVNK